jgi:predicted SprT family Zn-dependent metalloprotease
MPELNTHSIYDVQHRTLMLMEELGRAFLGKSLQELGWSFRFDRAKRRLGYCLWSNSGQKVKSISLSAPYALSHGWAVMEDVARHEIAHALDYESRGTSDHGSRWRDWALACGADPGRLYDGVPLRDAASRYVGSCINDCGYERPFYRAVTRAYFCPDCAEAEPERRSYLRVQERASGRVLSNGGLRLRAEGPPPFTERALDRALVKYSATCPHCKHTRGLTRRWKYRYACSNCCAKHAAGRFDSRFEYVITQNY